MAPGCDRGLRVLMMPDYRAHNPYQKLLAEALDELGIKVDFPEGYRRGLPLLRARQTYGKPDVLHLHWLGPYLKGENVVTQALYGLKLLMDVWLVRAAGTRVVWTIHNRVSHESKWPRLEMWVQGRLVRTVDRIIVHARASLEELRQDFPIPEEMANVIPHGHYRGAYGPAVDSKVARKELGLPASEKVFLFFGMLRPYKGIEKLIGEWKRVAVENGELLVIAGKALDKAFVSRLRDSSAGYPSIQMREGFVSDEQIPLYFSAADVVLLPFERILTSGSLLLAMSYGKPVIAPRTGAISETMAGADELLYDPADSHGLNASLNYALTHCLSGLGERTGNACAAFDWDAAGRMTLDAYSRAFRCPSFSF